MSALPSFASPYTLLAIGEDQLVFNPIVPVTSYGNITAPSAFFQPEAQFDFGQPQNNGAEFRESPLPPTEPTSGWQEKDLPADHDGLNRPVGNEDDMLACPDFPAPSFEEDDRDILACRDFPAPRTEDDRDALACNDFPPPPVYTDTLFG